MRTVIEAKDVTEEDLQEVEDITDGWYADTRIDWDDVWDRMERGSDLDLGPQLDSPAMRKMKAHVRKLRREG